MNPIGTKVRLRGNGKQVLGTVINTSSESDQEQVRFVECPGGRFTVLARWFRSADIEPVEQQEQRR